MVRTPSTLLDEALKLPANERARLAGELLRSLEDEQEEPLAQADYDAAWGSVIERRVREVETGEVTPVPWPVARRQILDDE
jgi:putative addiction module component (TIGR02574 family)